ncbi:MAG: SWIM zinc finger family protein [Clostridiales bacterium]|nr:SWIM zinc finger family protein [Clostridiales bacterium]
MEFGTWDASVHESKTQMKSLYRALNEMKPPVSLNRKKQTAVFSGRTGGLYHTSLDSCECADFQRRHCPCKHIYRLAYELDLLDETALVVGSDLSDEEIALVASYRRLSPQRREQVWQAVTSEQPDK